MNLGETYKRYVMGDALTDEDCASFNKFASLSKDLLSLGPTFYLASRELNRVSIELETYYLARKDRKTV